MKYVYNDGGRSNYFKGDANDCVVRAIAIATNRDYKEVYNQVKKIIGYTPRNSVKINDTKKVMKELGFKWESKMSIGSGCTTHLVESELPTDKVIVCKVSHHLTCIKYGVINDTFDCSRDGSRCVYGYWYM